MTQIIDGKVISTQIKDELKLEVESLKEKGVFPGLAVILVGNNSASQVYVRNKKTACEYVGIKSFSYELPEETSEAQLLELIDTLNHDGSISSILDPTHRIQNVVEEYKNQK